jgi:hypothetical protein
MGLYEHFDYKPLFGVERVGIENSSMMRNLIQGRDISRDGEENLQISCLEDAMQAPRNNVLARFTRSGIMGTNWKGPILAMRYLAIPNHLEHYKHIDMRDVRNVADFFSSNYRGYSDKSITSTACGIFCPADATYYEKQKYGELNISADHSSYGKQGSGIANLLGIPLHVEVMQGRAAPNDDLTSRQNLEAAELYRDVNSTIKGRTGNVQREEAERAAMIARFGPQAAMFGGTRNVDVGSMGFGTAHSRWLDDNLGSVVVARADGKPLMREHLEALCAYCKEMVGPRLLGSAAGIAVGDPVLGREAVLKAITKQDFLEFFEDFKLRKAQETKEIRWMVVSSPYDWTEQLLEADKEARRQRAAADAGRGEDSG